jgi:hypothetical protein
LNDLPRLPMCPMSDDESDERVRDGPADAHEDRGDDDARAHEGVDLGVVAVTEPSTPATAGSSVGRAAHSQEGLTERCAEQGKRRST